MSDITVNSKKIKTAVEMNIPISITTYTLPHDVEVYVDAVLAAVLEEIDQGSLYEYISYSIRELMTNAKKANTKRAYFEERHLDIHNPDDYEVGMQTFKEDVFKDLDYWFALQKKAGLYIKITLRKTKNALIVQIVNNVEITSIEMERIQAKIERAKEFSSMEEAFSTVLDSTEGAGLGIVIMLLMLKKIGLPSKSFRIESRNGLTVARLGIPMNFSAKAHTASLTKNIVQFITQMPQFPERILRIQRLIDDPESKLSSIADLIASDVSLTSDLLKLVNSVAFGLSKPCNNISDAVKFVGLRGIRSLLYSVGTLNVLSKQSEEQKGYWEHSYKTAFFSYNLAKLLKQRALLDDMYVCGLLHNLGTIVLSSLYPQTIEKISQFQQERQIPKKALDAILSGSRHSEVGAQLAEKWQLPPQIVNTIRYHNDVDAAPAEFQNLVSFVYAANVMIYLIEGTLDYAQIPEKILHQIGVTSEEELRRRCDHFNTMFEAQNPS